MPNLGKNAYMLLFGYADENPSLVLNSTEEFGHF